jgi:uncharacterized YigZ family protein
MKTLAHPVHSELEIKKSRFIGCVEPIQSQAEGLARVAELWKRHPEARHICFVLLVQGQVRQSDDGEPSGTAARPMLNVDNVLASVVRYFGGIKLGAGGLVRAYSQAISEPLAQAQWLEFKPQQQLQITFDYAYESTVRHQLELAGLEFEVIDYAEQVKAWVRGEEQALTPCLQRLQEQLKGTLICTSAD